MIANGSDLRALSERRGKLRIFLGYAPGVGKAYAMLSAAQRRRSAGRDVVVAHLDEGRHPDTLKLLDGLERLSSRRVFAGAAVLEAVDVDSVLRRRPDIVIIDELGRANPPSSRHPRRYQDVDELLDQGIDVYTTLNIQHIESLNDVVYQITGVRIEETVPDAFLHRADQIELVDVPPEDLLQRIHEGKVILGGRPIAPNDPFFRKGNLTALRELALRQTARQVDEQMRDYMQERQIEGPWAASDRLLVCISPSPMSANLVRAGCRLAQELDAPWHAVHVELPAARSSDPVAGARLNETLRLAERLGARVSTVTGQSIPDALLDFARENNVTQIIIGQPLRSRWQELLRGSVVNRLIHRSGNIDVHVISSQESAAAVAPQVAARPPLDLIAYLKALGILLLMTVAASLVNMVLTLNPANLVMFYLLAVVVVALRLGYGPAVLTAVLSVIVFNFFFVPPQLTFQVESAEYLITFFGLFVAGVVVAQLTARARRQTEAARRRERETAQLYSLSRELAATVDPETIVGLIVDHARQTFRSEIVLLLPVAGVLVPQRQDVAFRLGEAEMAAAQWAYERGRPAGRGTETLPDSRGYYLPLRTAQRTVGVLGLLLEEPADVEQQRLMMAFAAQAALAIEATQLGEEARQAQVLREKERLQSALLSSISHDLRTPLVSITGTLSSLRESGGYFDEAAQQDLLDGAYLEAERLNRLVGNLLDMSRLESGSLKLKREPYDLQEVIGVARAQLRDRLAGREINIDLADDLPLLNVDLVLFAQVFVNLLENAVKYAPEGTPIDISAGFDEEKVAVAIADRGPGVPEADRQQIFEKFYRAGGNGRSGIGLGLSICQGIVEAHGGTIRAENRSGGGARFVIQLYNTAIA